MNELIKRLLDKVSGPYLWIAAVGLVIGLALWKWTGAPQDQKLLRRQFLSVVGVAMVTGGIMLTYYALVSSRWFVFPTEKTGILVLRIDGDDNNDSLQGDLLASLNTRLWSEGLHERILLRGSEISVDERDGLSIGHDRARKFGNEHKASIVIWEENRGK